MENAKREIQTEDSKSGSGDSNSPLAPQPSALSPRPSALERTGVYICHCGVNIAQTVDVESIRESVAQRPDVAVARTYKFMCSNTGQELIQKDLQELGLTRVVVAACSPLMHELTFRGACEGAGLNRYLFQMANIREHCSWVHDDRKQATEKARMLVNAAVERVSRQEPLHALRAAIHPATLVVGGGIAGIQAALDLTETGHPVYLVEREASIGGKMATFDKTFPTLDCAACILTPKMVSAGHRANLKLLTCSEVEKVEGYIGNFTVHVRKRARYVDADRCTGCGQCWSHCPASRIPSKREIRLGDRIINRTDTKARVETLVEAPEPSEPSKPKDEKPPPTVRLKINGREVEAESGTTLLKAAEKLGIEIPTLCYNEDVTPYNFCRVCVVEMVREERRRTVPACSYRVRDGIEVFTDSERAETERRDVLERLLARCSEAPAVKTLAAKYGIEKSKYGYDPDERCILCGLCIRMCKDVVKANVLRFAEREGEKEVVTSCGREMDTDRCIVCGACAYVCPTGAITVEDLSQRKGEVPEFALGPKTAISIPFHQAVPKVPSIDPEACIHMQTGGCGKCAEVCEPEAVRFDMEDEVEEIDVGQILISTGFQQFDPSVMAQYGYGKLDNVLTGLDFERMLNSTGPTGGQVVTKDGKPPRAIGIIHCIGSRDAHHHAYCSRVCCMYALKFAHLVKDRTDAEVYQFYIDMRAFGKGYEEFYSRLLDEGVNVIRGKAAEVVEATWGDREGFLLVRCEDTLIGKFREIPVDMVILCAALEPNADAHEVGKIFSLSRSPDGFFLERHPKLDPVGTINDGIYIAGACQGPKDIPDTVAQAAGAAAHILGLISKGEVLLDPVRAVIDENLCGGCKVCNNLCPYSAITFDDEKKVSVVNETLCKGCGTCVAACPAGAIAGSGFTDEQILAEIDGILADAK